MDKSSDYSSLDFKFRLAQVRQILARDKIDSLLLSFYEEQCVSTASIYFVEWLFNGACGHLKRHLASPQFESVFISIGPSHLFIFCKEEHKSFFEGISQEIPT